MDAAEHAEALETALKDEGVDCSPVHDSPVHGINLWRDGDRVPADTVWRTPDEWRWGSDWGYHLSVAAPLDKVVARVIETVGGLTP